jgi:predicted nucleic acid-binding protein
MTLLVDTTVLIDILRGRYDRRRLLADLAQRGHSLTISSINVAEVFAGLRPKEEKDAERMLDIFLVYSLTTSLARRAGVLQYEWARRGRTLGLPVMIVAATALEYDLTVMTDNRKDFPIPDLKFFDLP